MHPRYLKEQSLSKQIFFFEPKFSTLLTRFHKNHSTQNVLLNMTEKWRHALDKAKTGGAIFMDLPKAFDTLNYNLLLAKLNGV